MNEWLARGMREAFTSLLGWTGVVVATLILGFCAGYWMGHREITGVGQTFKAFLLIPFLWLGFPRMFLACAVTGVAWYLPLQFESLWLRGGAAVANFLVWLFVIASVVVETANGKFFHY